MDYERPNPDELLKAANSENDYGKQGRLKVFFGACAGVGKTYAMLSALREKQDDGVKVLVGIVETHGRTETEEVAKNLLKLPLIETTHRGISLKEFDLEAALKAKPQIIAVDEFAHSNAPGSRHPKRWMDIEELLNAGIDVYTTLNVQHLESLNDIVAGITGIRVKETIPDAIFDSVNDITLVDIPSDELLERLKEGKVYITDLGKKRAAENFFRKENLLALRELALRRTAERVDAQTDIYSRYMQQQRRASEKLAVCIGAGDLSPRLLRATKRLASSLRASWVAVYVENARHYNLGREAQAKLERNLRMAEELGAKTEIIRGDTASTAIIDYARKNNVTKIIAGKPTKSHWREIFQGSLVNDLIRQSGDIDVYVITGDEIAPPVTLKETQTTARNWKGYLTAALAVTAVTLLGLPLRDTISHDSVVILYLVAVLILASRFGWAVSSFASILGVLSFNFFFTQPYYSFNVYESRDIVTLFMLLVASITVGSQTSKLQAQSRFFRRKERNTSALYSMSHELAATRGRKNLILVIAKHLEQAMDGIATLWLPDNDGNLELATHPDLKAEVKEESVARWVYANKQAAGIGTKSMPSARGYYLPLSGSVGAIGVIGLIVREAEKPLSSDEKDLLETFAILATSALERASIADLAEQRKVEAESEKLRNTLLSSVSHDLRTPLSSIKGVISSLLMDDIKLNAATKKELLVSAHDEVARLERIVSNLLDITLLESGKLKLNQDYYFAEEMIGNALKAIDPMLGARHVETKLEANLPAIWVDGLLMEQVIVNLLENAVKYTPKDSRIALSVNIYRKNLMQIKVEDNGPGIPAGEEDKIFDKFITAGKDSKQRRGTGLGLAICRGIVRAHDGTINAHNTGHGSLFTITLPLGVEPQLEEAS